MKFRITPASIAIWFFVVLALYLATFHGIEHFRHRKGPWEVRFQTDARGIPSIQIAQRNVGLSNLTLVFPRAQFGTTGLNQLVRFQRPDQQIPFGKVRHQDLTYLPGVVGLDLFGHEIELVPRTLIIDRREVPWRSNTTIDLNQHSTKG